MRRTGRFIGIIIGLFVTAEWVGAQNLPLPLLSPTCPAPGTPFRAGTAFAAVAFKSTILAGWGFGSFDSSKKARIYQSVDAGCTWTMIQTTGTMPDSLTFGKLAVFQNNMVFVGGRDMNAAMAYNNNLYYSSDISTWSTFTSTLLARTGHQVAVIRGNPDLLYILGGESAGICEKTVIRVLSSPVWSATALAPAPWWGRCHLAAAVVNADLQGNGRIVITGGYSGGDPRTSMSDVWISSSDGNSWLQLTSNAPWGPRSGHSMVVIKDALFLTGGCNTTQTPLNDIWVSPDAGVSWMLVTGSANYPPRVQQRAIALGNQMIVLGGSSFPNAGVDYKDAWIGYV
jgi:hypothetical protein